MFKHIEIVLSSKICNCSDGNGVGEGGNLQWQVGPSCDKGGGNGLSITCEKCKVQLQIPRPAFIGYFKYQDYKVVEEKSQSRLDIIEA